ncbi:serine/threonine-protein kinase [Tundrisphaera lichenicola]|uniref:serine/threonine-protein kinase n=1 Tax=Tundrisphaera lichenicola TaxID=2029860 RepID=UPI003EB6CFF4
MTDDAFESRVLDFERDWRRDGPREIGDYLADPFGPGSPGRGHLLAELICVDLEYRWRSPDLAGRTTLRDYVGRFPELVSLDRLPLDLVVEEYRVRRLWGDRPSHEEFLSSFPEWRGQIRLELIRIDGEIEEESAEPVSTMPSRNPPQERPVDPDPGIPLLSDRDFLLRRLIGSGMAGKVYEAKQHGAGRDVAVKFLRKSLMRHPNVVRRFIDEARTIAGLHHPNIVGTQGLGRTPAGSYFIVMDLVDGGNLARIIGERVVAEEEAIRWTMELCGALEHAHGKGIVHCDLKPANILLDDRGRIRVTDFGLARSLVAETSGVVEVEGTAPFMAPEQVSRAWGPIDHRTDIYGIGAVLCTLLTGRPPYVGRRVPDILADVVALNPVVPPLMIRPGLSESLGDLCRKCLSKNPEDRYQAVGEIRSALAAI